MSLYKSHKEYSSRLTRVESQKLKNQTWIFLGITLVVILIIARFFVPFLIKASIFLGDIRKTNEPIEVINPAFEAPPLISSLPNATASAQINLNGQAPPNAALSLFVNGLKTAETIATNDSTFTFYDVPINPGTNQLYVESLSQGKNSIKSATQTISYYAEKPLLEIYEPMENQKFFGNLEQQITLHGKTNPENIVYLNDRILVTGPDGLFKSSYILKDGENQLLFSATDPAGNRTELTLKVNYSP